MKLNLILKLIGLGLLGIGGYVVTQTASVYDLLDIPTKVGHEHLEFQVLRGGLVAGLGVFTLVASLGRPWPVLMAHFVLWPMVGLALVRILGVDAKSPYYGLQMQWALTEFALGLASVVYLFRRRRFEAHKKDVEQRASRSDYS